MAWSGQRVPWWSLAVGLGAAAAVAWRLAGGPGWAEAAAYFVAAVGLAAVIGGLLRLQTIGEDRGAWSLAHLSAWLAPALLLLAAQNPVGMAAGGAVAILAVWLTCPGAGFRKVEARAHSLAVAAALHAGAAAAASGWPLVSAAFLVSSLGMVAALSIGREIWAAPRDPKRPLAGIGMAMQVILVAVPVIHISGGAGSGLLPESAGFGQAAAREAPAEEESTGVAGGFAGAIVRPEPSGWVKLVAPTPGRATGSGTPPGSIRFDGEYWLFRWPFTRPPSNARTFRGAPSAIFFRTTDRARLQMEARQRLDQPVRMDCCRGLTVEVLNADIHPGTVSMEVALADSRRPSLQASLGSVPLRSVPDLSRERPPPVRETVEYKFPAPARLREFDEIRVTFHRKMARMDQSARVSIERFQFTR